MITTTFPSLPRLHDLLARAAESGRLGKTLLLLPGGIMRAEVDSTLTANSQGIAGLETATLTGFALAVSGLEPPRTDKLHALVSSIIRRDGTSAISGQSRHAARVKAYLRLFDSFRAESLDEHQVARYVQDAGYSGELPSRIVSLYAEYLHLLSKHGLHDSAHIFSAASIALDLFPVSYAKIFACGFYSLTGCQAELLVKLAKKNPGKFELLIELCPESVSHVGVKGLHEAMLTCQPVSSLYSPFRGIYSGLIDMHNEPLPVLRHINSKTPLTENHAALRWAQDKIEQGIRPADMAILVTGIENRLNDLENLFRGAGIPHSILQSRSSASMPYAQLVKSILELLGEDADPSALRRMISSPCLKVEAGQRELCRLLVGAAKFRRSPEGIKNWQVALSAYSERLSRSDRHSVFIYHTRFNRTSAINAVSVLHEFLSELVGIREAKGSEFLSRLVRFLASRFFISSSLVPFARKLALQAGSLLALGLGLSAVEAAETAFEQITSPAVCTPSPDTIAIAPLLAGRHLVREHLYICGLTNDAFPFKRSFLPLLPNLAKVGVGGIDRSAESRHLYYLLTRRAKEVVLSYPQNIGFRATTPSFYFDLERTDEDIACPQPSEHDSWDLVGNLGNSPPLSSAWTAALQDYLHRFPSQQKGLHGALAENLRMLTPACEYSGLVHGHCEQRINQFVLREIPVTGVEDFARCPLRFFFKNVLHITEDVDDADKLYDPREKGTVLHNLFASFYRAWRANNGANPVAGDTKAASNLMSEKIRELLAKDDSEEIPVYLMQWLASMCAGESVRGDAAAFLACEVLNAMPVPHEIEHPVSVELFGLRLKGRIDRLNIENGIADILDYKTGIPPTFSSVYAGSEIQLPVYALIWSAIDRANDVSFHHYSIGKSTKLVVSKSKKHDVYVSEAVAHASELLPVISGAIRKGIFNKVIDNDLSANCQYARLCRRLCSKLSKPVEDLAALPVSLFRISVSKEEK